MLHTQLKLISSKRKAFLFFEFNIDTFKAYDRDGDKKISRKEFIEFIEDSWKAAFIILGDSVNKQQPNNPINVQKLNMWA